MNYCKMLLTPRMTLLIVGGSMIYAFGLNQFIIPLGLYNGGFLGIAQLLRHFMEVIFNVDFGNVNVSGIMYFILNIPLLVISWKRFGHEFIAKTIYCVAWYSFLLTAVPIADHLIVDEHLTACIAGGIICGIGAGMTMLSAGSGGGEEILGLLLMQKNPNLSVGKVSYMLNFFIFSACAYLFSISAAIYSVFFTGIAYYVLDKVHFQNIMLKMIIITKKPELEKIVFDTVNRGVTKLHAYGAYSNEKGEALITIVSKTELMELKPLLLAADPNVFIIVEENVSVIGNFEKRLE